MHPFFSLMYLLFDIVSRQNPPLSPLSTHEGQSGQIHICVTISSCFVIDGICVESSIQLPLFQNPVFIPLILASNLKNIWLCRIEALSAGN